MVVGVDVYSRRQMRKVFERALNSGITMLLTSHSMEECEMLCTRFGIMSSGQLKCLGYINDLKRKYENKYYLTINGNQFYFNQILIYLKKSFRIEIHHENESTIIFVCSLSRPIELFERIENIKEEYFIETYQIEENSLEQIFIHLQNEFYSGN